MITTVWLRFDFSKYPTHHGSRALTDSHIAVFTGVDVEDYGRLQKCLDELITGGVVNRVAYEVDNSLLTKGNPLKIYVTDKNSEPAFVRVSRHRHDIANVAPTIEEALVAACKVSGHPVPEFLKQACCPKPVRPLAAGWDAVAARDRAVKPVPTEPTVAKSVPKPADALVLESEPKSLAAQIAQMLGLR